MNSKIIAGISIGLIVGLALGILISVFLLPNLIGDFGLDDSDYERIAVFSGSTARHDFGNYSYIFFYKYDSPTTNAEDGIVLYVRGLYEIIPMDAGQTHTVLDLQVKVSEVYDDYVVLLAKLS